MKKVLVLIVVVAVGLVASAQTYITKTPDCEILETDAQSKTTSGTSEETFYTYTVKAGQLKSDGDCLDINYSASHAANTNAATQVIRFDDSQVAITTTVGSGTLYWFPVSVCYRNATTLVIYGGQFRTAQTTSIVSSTITEDPTIENVLTVKVTTSVQAGDITGNFFRVGFCRGV